MSQPDENSSRRFNSYFLTNQEIILRNLHLLGVSAAKCEHQTKLPLDTVTLNHPKVVWFILYHSLRHLMAPQDFTKTFEAWYPPRTPSDQIEFKKLCASSIQKLEMQGKVPQNFMINKAVFDQQERIVEFLRYLTEFALRAAYLHAQGQCLTQVALRAASKDQRSSMQDINLFYPYLMSPSTPEVSTETLECLEAHIDAQRKKLLSKRTRERLPSFPQDELINNIFYLQEIKKKLTTKVPREFFSQNRAFDRTQLLDRCSAVWKELNVDLDDEVELGRNDLVEADGQWFELDAHWERWLASLRKKMQNIHAKTVSDTCSNRDPIGQLRALKESMKKELEGLGELTKRVQRNLSLG